MRIKKLLLIISLTFLSSYGLVFAAIGDKCADSFWNPKTPEYHSPVRVCLPASTDPSDHNLKPEDWKASISILRETIAKPPYNIGKHCEEVGCNKNKTKCDDGNCKLDKTTAFTRFEGEDGGDKFYFEGGSGTNCKNGEKPWLAKGVSIISVLCNCKCVGDLCPPPEPPWQIDNTNKNLTNSSSNKCENLVKLSNFTATPTDKGISLNWNTETELDSQGFRIWRAIPDLSRYCGCSGNIEDYTQIQVLDKEGKPVLIPAKGSITSGSNYSYLDKGAKPGIAYCYALEDVDSKGESKFYFEYVAFTQDNLEETK